MAIQWSHFGHTFDAQAKEVVCAAFVASCETLSANGDSRFNGRRGHYAREVVARLVVGFARAGERDPQLLARAVVNQMNVV